MRRLATAIFIVLVFVIFECDLSGTAAALADDADTLTIGDKRFRLDGIDAPEIDQTCLDGRGQLYPCGRWALEAIDAFSAGRPAACQDIGADPAHPKRRIGQCYIEKTYLNRWLVQQGWALNFEPYAKGRFQRDEAQARTAQLGLWQGCFVRPRDFRRWNKHRAELLGPHCPEGARGKLFPADAGMPEGCEIKAKYALRALPYQGIYHLPGCGSYLRTKHPDRWFCSEQEAIEAGFRSSWMCWLR
jgi:endonuclease YncB( thermonuclease family)